MSHRYQTRDREEKSPHGGFSFIFFEKIPFLRYSIDMTETPNKLPDHKPKQHNQYLHWNEKTITDFSPDAVADLYDHGYVFTRLGKGIMHQTRSVRIDLSKFELSSENRRILKKINNPEVVGFIETTTLPFSNYTWHISKKAKDFYEKKFGPNVMTANKIKELLTEPARSNFNCLIRYISKENTKNVSEIGWTISYRTSSMLHYAYPFYDLERSPKDMGLGMMTMAISLEKNTGSLYVYLGSLQRPSDVYKLQFSGIEWFDGGPEKKGTWQTDIEVAKEILKKIS